MRVAIGIVDHRTPSEAGRRLAEHFEVLRLTNASEAVGSRWLGFGANHNLLLDRAAQADWYVALNPDATAQPSEIRALVSHADRAALTIAAPLLRSPWGVTGQPQAAFPSPTSWWRATFGQDCTIVSNASVVVSTCVSGACLAIDRRRAPELRFDERYFMYFEDTDLCLRVGQRGGRVGVVQAVTVDHATGWSSSDPLRWRRGVEYARGALTFANVAGLSTKGMRAAGLCRFGSRVALGRTLQARVSARVITRGFLQYPRAAGLRELADDYNRSLLAGGD